MDSTESANTSRCITNFPSRSKYSSLGKPTKACDYSSGWPPTHSLYECSSPTSHFASGGEFWVILLASANSARGVIFSLKFFFFPFLSFLFHHIFFSFFSRQFIDGRHDETT